MNVLDCLDFVNSIVQNDHHECPLAETFDDLDELVLLLVAAVRLSGCLETCESEEDLREAIRHTMSLISCEIFTFAQLSSEADRVEAELMEWGDGVRDELQKIAESN